MSHCQYCHRGVAYGNAVSHAKNRLKRLFKPNLQKLKVLKGGISTRVTLCTRCIKRLRHDGKIGSFMLVKAAPTTSVKLPESMKKPLVEKEKIVRQVKEDKAKETVKIEDIVGKKN